MNHFDSDLITQLADYIVAPDHAEEGLHRRAYPVSTGDTLRVNISALSEVGQVFATRALLAWTEVSGIRFDIVTGRDVYINFTDDRPRATAQLSYTDGFISYAHVNVSTTFQRNGTSIDSVDSEAFSFYLHEIGHALGLHHPGPYERPYIYGEDTVFTNDSYQTTVMSYFPQGHNTDIEASNARTLTPMIADIIAIHELYGTPVLRDGDTIYGVGANMGGHLGAALNDWTAGNFIVSITLTIFDSGGIDTIDFSTDTDDQHVILQPETASDVYGLIGNLVIARDTLIENYVAGYGDDTITGNEADNVIEGRAGADSIDGAAGSDTAAYTGSDVAVTVNLSDDTATGGHAEGDTLISIENLSGSAHDDTLTGDAGNNVIEGGAGGDAIDGMGGDDTASYINSNAAVAIDLSRGTAAGGHAAGDTITNIEHLLGSRYNDVLTGDASANRLDGGAGNDRLAGGGGADTLVGGPGNDAAYYATSPDAVSVNLETNTATGGDAEGDSLISIENLSGSAFDDTLTGDADNNVLSGRAGADALDGGEGIDTVSYSGSKAGVTVRLLTGEGLRGDAEGDTLTNIENLIGSRYNDAFGGDLGNNVLRGGPGNDGLWGSGGDDTLVGGPGADRFHGGSGQDTVSYYDSKEGVTIRLHSLAAAGGDAKGDTFETLLNVAYTDAGGLEQIDTLPDVEHLIGSAHNDILAGDRRDNRIDGGTGDDTLYGGPGGGDDGMTGGLGNDRLFGGQGADTLDGGPGDDTLAGGPGADIFVFGSGNGTDTVTDFSAGTDKVDLTAFDIDSIDDITMTAGEDGATIDLADIGGGSILLADLATLPEAGDFVV